MALALLLFGSILLYPLTSSALKVTFYREPHCNGTALGQLENLSKGNCYHNYTDEVNTGGIATGYQVDATDSDGDNAVVFYQFDECDPKTQIALSNTPFCVSGTFGAFQVLSPEDCCLDPAYWQGGGFEGPPSDMNVPQPSATVTVSSIPTVVTDTASISTVYPSPFTASATISTTAPSLEARRARAKEQPTSDTDQPAIYHGKIHNWGGQAYKMHQLAHGVYRGVDLEDWDDNIHIKDDTLLDLPDYGVPDTPSSSTVAPLSSPNPLLAARFFRSPACQAMLQCAYDVGTAAIVNIAWGVKAFADIALQTYNRGRRIYGSQVTQGLWDWLNKPLICAVIGGSIANGGFGALGGYIGGITQGKSTDAAKCSTAGDEKEVLEDIVHLSLQGEPTGKVSDMSVAVPLPNGQTAILTMAAREGNDHTESVCGSATLSP